MAKNDSLIKYNNNRQLQSLDEQWRRRIMNCKTEKHREIESEIYNRVRSRIEELQHTHGTVSRYKRTAIEDETREEVFREYESLSRVSNTSVDAPFVPQTAKPSTKIIPIQVNPPIYTKGEVVNANEMYEYYSYDYGYGEEEQAEVKQITIHGGYVLAVIAWSFVFFI